MKKKACRRTDYKHKDFINTLKNIGKHEKHKKEEGGLLMVAHEKRNVNAIQPEAFA